MQILIDFVPLLIALAVYKMHGIYAATIALMIVLPLIPLGQLLMKKQVSQVHAWSAALVLIFGTATLVFRDPRFIMWKPSILYFSAAIVFVVTAFVSEKSLVERMLGQSVKLEAVHWRQLNWIWAAFFALLAAVNLYVAYNYAEATWFQFKVWGMTGMLFVFVVAQSVWIAVKSPQALNTENNGDN